MGKITITINGKQIEAESGKTILEIAKENGIYVPTLCYLKGINEDSNCRICMVEILNSGKLVTSCSTKAADGMIVETESKRVVESRKNTLTLLLSNHHKDCENCQKNNECDLQDLFEMYDIEENDEKFEKTEFEIDKSSPCVIRNNNKCILCGRCAKICAKVQDVHALTKQNRGFNTIMGCAFNGDLRESTCVGCGQCTLVCPTAALIENDETDKVMQLLSDKSNFVVAQVAPSVRVSLSEAFGEEIGTFDEGRMVQALKIIGFNKVFDINLGADFTVIEESNELIERIEKNLELPQFSSCCPGWFKFVSEFYPDHANNLSTCKSPTEMLGAIVKNFYAKKENIAFDKIKVVGIMPCTAKKGEKERGKDVDCVLTTRELAKLIKKNNIDYVNLKGMAFDTPLSYYSGAGLIFGATGGVTEAVLRHVCEKLDKQSNQIDFEMVRKSEGRKEVVVRAGELKLNLCVVNGLSNAKKVIDDIVSGKKHYHFVEVMACPGGCVNGGGQIYVDYSKVNVNDVIAKRADSLYRKDKSLKERKSNQNIAMNEIYKSFFIPSPKRAKELLHYRND